LWTDRWRSGPELATRRSKPSWRKGLGVNAIARRLNFDPKTVHRYADAADVNDLLGPGRAGFRYSMLDSFAPYLLNRCAEGVTATTLLFNEIKARGYTGGSRTLRRWLVEVRGDEPQPATPPPPPSTRDITDLIRRPSAKLTDDQTATLVGLCQQCPQLATVRDLAHGFATWSPSPEDSAETATPSSPA
jgi:hypothetical protein